MTKKISQNGSDQRLGALFEIDEGFPCPVGTTLLCAFASARPADFNFLKPGDLIDLHNSAFAGIPEWDAFSEHYGFCESCNA
jgi:hypothetical protein